MLAEVIILLPIALALVGLARFVMFLFPESTGNRNHYDGNFGDTDQTLKSYDSLTDDEHNEMAAFFGYCQGDEKK